jgi:hypothetical protein
MRKKKNTEVYEIEADPDIGPTEEYPWRKLDPKGPWPVDWQQTIIDGFKFVCIVNHYKIINRKAMLLCKFKAGWMHYFPVHRTYKEIQRSGVSVSVIDDYLVKHNLVSPNSSIKNRWRKLGYRNNPNNTKSKISVSSYDEFTTDRKILELHKKHVGVEEKLDKLAYYCQSCNRVLTFN